MTISAKRIGTLIWMLIYGGLFAVGLGFALDGIGESWGWALIAAGMLAIVVGCVLVWIRSRMPAP